MPATTTFDETMLLLLPVRPQASSSSSAIKSFGKFTLIFQNPFFRRIIDIGLQDTLLL